MKAVCDECVGLEKRVLVKGSPGCGKSFVIMWWILNHFNDHLGSHTSNFLVLVPYRRLAQQMFQILIDVIVRGENKNIQNNIKVLQGQFPDMTFMERMKVVISTYEHGYNAYKRMKSELRPFYVVIDEVHNIFYSHRGWQLEPFLDENNLLVLSGTLIGNDQKRLLGRMKTAYIWDMNSVKDYLPIKSSTTDIVHLDKIASPFRVAQQFIDNGGIFYFCPTVNLAVLKAYEFAVQNKLTIINPLEPLEIDKLRSKSRITTLHRTLIQTTSRDIDHSGRITGNDLDRIPMIYIDHSTHFDDNIRSILSKDQNCKLIVFCTTTLCEGLNLKSVKTVFIAGGVWDLRRVKQIEGRAGRFGEVQTVYKGNIASIPRDDLVMDLFDYIKVEIRGQTDHFNQGLHATGKYSPEEERLIANVITLLLNDHCSSVESWLNSRFGIDIGIRYRDFQKILEKKKTNEIIRSEEALFRMNISNDLDLEIYNNTFRPLLKLNFRELHGIFCSMEYENDDDELQLQYENSGS